MNLSDWLTVECPYKLMMAVTLTLGLVYVTVNKNHPKSGKICKKKDSQILTYEDLVGKTWLTAKIRDSGTVCAAVRARFTRLSWDRVRWKAEIKEMNLKKQSLKNIYFLFSKNIFRFEKYFLKKKNPKKSKNKNHILKKIYNMVSFENFSFIFYFSKNFFFQIEKLKNKYFSNDFF